MLNPNDFFDPESCYALDLCPEGPPPQLLLVNFQFLATIWLFVT